MLGSAKEADTFLSAKSNAGLAPPNRVTTRPIAGSRSLDSVGVGYIRQPAAWAGPVPPHRDRGGAVGPAVADQLDAVHRRILLGGIASGSPDTSL